MSLRVPRIAACLAGAALFAASASAKVTSSRAQQICLTAVKVLQPPVKFAQVNKDELTTTEDKIMIFLTARRVDNNAPVRIACTVDRSTSMATVVQLTQP